MEGHRSAQVLASVKQSPGSEKKDRKTQRLGRKPHWSFLYTKSGVT